MKANKLSNGNTTKAIDALDRETDYGYDTMNRLTQITSPSGSATVSTYAYNLLGQMTSATDFEGQTTTYAYDHIGRQTSMTDPIGTVGYNYDMGWNLLNEEDTTGALTTTFVHAPQGPVGPVLADVAGSNPASGTYRYYTLDHLGSTNGLYDGAKAKISALAYTPYGASYSDVGPGPLPRYTGHLWDGAAGLHFAPYRAYAPDLARWLSRDPLGMVDGPNVYGYVRGNPSTNHDSLGLWGCSPRRKVPPYYDPNSKCAVSGRENGYVDTCTQKDINECEEGCKNQRRRLIWCGIKRIPLPGGGTLVQRKCCCSQKIDPPRV